MAQETIGVGFGAMQAEMKCWAVHLQAAMLGDCPIHLAMQMLWMDDSVAWVCHLTHRICPLLPSQGLQHGMHPCHQKCLDAPMQWMAMNHWGWKA
jgi:hypothetical protein